MLKTIFACIVTCLATVEAKCSVPESVLWIGSDAFTEKMQNCAIKNVGVGSLTSSCLVGEYDGALSGGCASCFGATVECGRNKCMMECVRDSGAPGCTACTLEKGCQADLNVCTGFDQGPPYPKSKLSPSGDGLSVTSTTKSVAVYGLSLFLGLVLLLA